MNILNALAKYFSRGCTGYTFGTLLLLFLPILIIAEEHTSLKTLEEKLTPYFQRKSPGTIDGIAKKTGTKTPTLSDLLTVAVCWEQLSEGFRKIYQSSVSIPEDFSLYMTPGYGLEICYSAQGRNAVDTADSFGYDTSDWKKRVDDANNVPDYVDRVAWAMDSAWSMEIERFGFLPPVPYTSDFFKSDRFKVCIEDLGGELYGITCPVISDGDSDSGYACLLSIRNNWDGWNINETIDYETHPEKGINVTCVHEFFHAIQFRMCRSLRNEIFIDSFPVSWLEATAGMMEEAGFSDVNDYVQYSDTYFSDPSRFTLFSSENSAAVYSNVLFCLFMHEKMCSGENRVEFVKSVFDGNLTEPKPFSSLMSNAAGKIGYSFSQVLNRFHVESFYSGTRACNGLFVNDAPLYPDLKYTRGELNDKGRVDVTVYPWSVRYLSYVNDDGYDSLEMNFQLSDGTDGDAVSVSVILCNGGQGGNDSIVCCRSMKELCAPIIVRGMNAYSEAVIVLSNGIRGKNISMNVSLGNRDAKVIGERLSVGKTVLMQNHVQTVLLNGKKMKRNEMIISENEKNHPDSKRCSGVYIHNSGYGNTASVNVK